MCLTDGLVFIAGVTFVKGVMGQTHLCLVCWFILILQLTNWVLFASGNLFLFGIVLIEISERRV